MCGIVGALSDSQANQDLYDALTIIQHRGQDAAGIISSDHGRLHLRKGNGLVRDVLRKKQMLALKGDMGIGHVRYPTAGTLDEGESQPFYVNSPYGITLAHNGNLTNAAALKAALAKTGLRHLNTSSDSEVLLNVFAQALQQIGKLELTEDDIFQAVGEVHARCRGAYAVIAMITGYGLVAFRDPHGIRPLCYGKRQARAAGAPEYLIASESVALKCLAYDFIDDIAPGEAVFIREHDHQVFKRQCVPGVEHTPCLFEYVYLARPDSFLDKISVYKVRLRMGEYLAQKILREYDQLDIDVVMPIPSSARHSAFQLARELGLVYREGFVKNQYVGRTFIMPGQKIRRKSVRNKLNTIDLEFNGKNVLLVDDSIVRGTTSEQIIKMARNAGAKHVFFASAAPPVRYPNVYGIDIPTSSELIAHGKTEAEICQAIGADELIYQSLDDLIAAAREGNASITRFEDSVFSGNYVTGDVSDDYLAELAQQRNDAAKQANDDAVPANPVDLPNR